MRAKVTILILALLIPFIPATSATIPKKGAPCAKLGATQVSKSLKYTCVKSGSKRVWSKGVLVTPKATPTPTPTASATPTPTPSVSPTPNPTLSPTTSPTFAPGADVSKCKLPIADGRGDVAIGGFPRIDERLKSQGDVLVKVLLVDFPDHQATITPQTAFARFAQSADLFAELSYGRMKFELQPTYKWYRMSKSAKEYAPLNRSFVSHKSYIMEAAELADKEVDFSNADAILIIANPSAKDIGYSGPAFAAVFGTGITLDGKYISNGATSSYDINTWEYIWANHEFGHALGLPDLYAFRGEDPTNPMDYHRFVGEYSLMGLSALWSNSPGFLAWERWLLGWIDDSQMYCMNENSASVLISPVERKGGTKAVVVPISPTKAVVVESRRAEGVDKNLVKPGALVYLVDSSIQSGFGPVRVYPSDNKNDPRKLQSTRAEGEGVTVEGIKVTVKKSSTEGDLVEVTRN